MQSKFRVLQESISLCSVIQKIWKREEIRILKFQFYLLMSQLKNDNYKLKEQETNTSPPKLCFVSFSSFSTQPNGGRKKSKVARV